MPSIETAYLTQDAVLFPFDGTDIHNEIKRGDPVEIKVRWLTGRSQSLSAQGTPLALDATVIVDRVIENRSLLFLGSLSEWLGTGSEGDDSELMEVVSYKETPDLKGRVERRSVGLVYYRDTPPAES